MKPQKNISIHDKKIQSTYKVPENYFDELEQNILSKTIHKKKGLLFTPWFKYASIAASIILFYGLYLVVKTTNTNSNEMAEVSTELILELEDIEITEDDLVSLVSMEELNEFGSIINEEINEDITEDFDPMDVYDEI